MLFERVEEVCLEFLSQSTNPLAPVELLYELCLRAEGVGMELTLEGLLDFLRNHAAVVVVEGPDETVPVSMMEFAQAGIIMGPRAILKSRIPSRNDLKENFRLQLEQMRSSLLDALKQAKKREDHEAIRELETALERSDALRERMEGF